MRAVAIDSNGFFLSDLAGDPAYTGAAGTAPAPAGNRFSHYRPRWNGSEWVEGADPAEVLKLASDGRASQERAWRDAELARADIQLQLVLDGNAKATGTAEAWRAYRNALRDMPAQDPDPFKWIRPEAP